MGSSYLPPPEQNVVNVGDEISASSLAGINAASPGLSAQNPVASVSHVDGRINTIQLTPGPQGPAGPAGADGVAGAAGAAGSNGNDGADAAQWVYRGAYDGGYTYAPNDFVTADGSSYVMYAFIGAAGYHPAAHPGNFQLIASKGNDGPAGSNGNNGNDGAQGQTGSPGNDGAQGPAGAGVINWRSAYDNSSYYLQNDAVSDGGSSWICTSSTSGNTPYIGSGLWGLLAQAGTNGADGTNGSIPPYTNCVWAYGTWYNSSITTVYDTNYNYVNVLTF